MERQSNPPCFSDLREAIKPSQRRACLLILIQQITQTAGSPDSKPPKAAVNWKMQCLYQSLKVPLCLAPAYLTKLTSHHLVCSSSTLVRVAFHVGWLIFPHFSMNIPGTLSVLGTLEHLLFPLPRVLGTHLVPPLGLCTCERLSLEWCFFMSSHSSSLTFFKLCSNITPPLPIYFRIVFSAITFCHLNPSLSSPLLHLWTCIAIWNWAWFMFVVGFNKPYEFNDLVTCISFFTASRRELWA